MDPRQEETEMEENWRTVQANAVVRPHEVRDPDKARAIAESIKRHGWYERPLLVWDSPNGRWYLTGTHRLAALDRLAAEGWDEDCEIPLVCVDCDAIERACEDRGVTADELWRDDDELEAILREYGDAYAADLVADEIRANDQT